MVEQQIRLMHIIKITEFPAAATINNYKLRLKHKSAWKLRSLEGISSTVVTQKFFREASLMAPDISCLWVVSLHSPPASLQGLLPSVSLSCIFSRAVRGWGHCKMSSEGLGEWLSGQKLFYRRVPRLVPSTCNKLQGIHLLLASQSTGICVHTLAWTMHMNEFKKKLLNTSPKAVKLVIRKHTEKKCFSLPLYASLQALEGFVFTWETEQCSTLHNRMVN